MSIKSKIKIQRKKCEMACSYIRNVVELLTPPQCGRIADPPAM